MPLRQQQEVSSGREQLGWDPVPGVAAELGMPIEKSVHLCLILLGLERARGVN
jgi:hypothetical protein